MTQRTTPGRRPMPAVPGIVVVVAAVVVTVGAGLASSGVGPVVSPDFNDGATVRSASHVVDIRDLRFEPSEQVVAKGDTIVWVNHDIVPHTVADADSSWSSGHLASGDTWHMVVGADGEISYFCEYHPTMRGGIRVK